MTQNRSPIATQVADKHPDRDRPGPVFGLVLHTTGRGVVKRAQREGVAPEERALDYYAQSVASCHYLIGYDGTVYQLSADDRRVPHVGIRGDERRRYLAGEWSGDFSARAVARWRERWPDRASPQHLYPSSSPNDDYVGCEMIPLRRRRHGWHYTAAQHVAAATLALDLANRHGWPEGWHRTSRLVGHEDLDAYGRWKAFGGWDPGALRRRPWLSWPWILTMIDVADAGRRLG